MKELIEQVENHLKKSKRVQIIIGVVILILGIVIFFLPSGEDDTNNKLIFAYSMTGIGFLTILFPALRNDNKNALIVALKNNPDDIYQVYVKHNIINGGHNSTVLVFIMQSRKVIIIQIPKGEDDLWMSRVQVSLPNAKLGYEE